MDWVQVQYNGWKGRGWGGVGWGILPREYFLKFAVASFVYFFKHIHSVFHFVRNMNFETFSFRLLLIENVFEINDDVLQRQEKIG